MISCICWHSLSTNLCSLSALKMANKKCIVFRFVAKQLVIIYYFFMCVKKKIEFIYFGSFMKRFSGNRFFLDRFCNNMSTLLVRFFYLKKKTWILSIKKLLIFLLFSIAVPRLSTIHLKAGVYLTPDQIILKINFNDQ